MAKTRRLITCLTVIVLSIISLPSLANQPKKIVLGTYAYPNINREAAVKPLANLVESSLSLPTKVLVADSPTELAHLVAQNHVQIAVPNLVGFAQIAAANRDVYPLAVPDNLGSTYTSSIVINANSLGNPDSLIESLRLNRTPVGMVWPDSTSGAIVATSHINAMLVEHQQAPLQKIAYLQSHQNVFSALEQKSVNIGVLATKVFVEQSETSETKLLEVWRSEPIPYGPIVCRQNVVELCARIRTLLLDKNTNTKLVLEGLKAGWVEFESSHVFVVPDTKTYAPFIEHFAKKQ